MVMKFNAHSFEKPILVLIIACFFLPLVLAGFLQLFETPLPHTQWLRNATLQRTILQPERLSGRTLWSGACQKNVADRFNTGFAGREVLIRLTCEMWYRLFDKTPLNTPIVLGKDDTIFNENYLIDYCLTRTTSSQLEPLLRDLRQLQEKCTTFGIGFVFVMTPGKASIMSEYLPQAWLARIDPRPRTYDLMVPLIEQYGLYFVNGHHLTQLAKPKALTPIFPKGGIHWDPYASCVTANAILSTLRTQGHKIAPIDYVDIREAPSPAGEECDVLSLMNLAISWNYPTTELTIKSRPQSESSHLKIAIIGGSFMTKFSRQLSASEPGLRIDHFFYYTKGAASYIDGQERITTAKCLNFDFKALFASNCLVLEANEDLLEETGPLHLREFVRDALKYLSDHQLVAATSPRPP